MRTLEISGRNMLSFPPGSFEALRDMTSVRHLVLKVPLVPRCLRQLTWLRSLHIEAAQPEEAGVLSARLQRALPALQHLTALALCCVPLWRPSLMAALDALPRVRRLVACAAWDVYSSDGSRRSTLPPENLPALPFLSRLETLGSNGDLLLRNPQLLEAATQLQHLWVMGGGRQRDGYELAWQRFIQWAQQQQQLRSISLGPAYDWSGPVPFDIAGDQWRGLIALSQHLPDVVLHGCPPDLTNRTSIDDMWMPLFADAA